MTSIGVAFVLFSVFVFCIGVEYIWWFVRYRQNLREHEKSEIESMLYQIDHLQSDISKTLTETPHYHPVQTPVLESAQIWHQ